MSIEKLGQYFNTIEDPRCPGKVEHRLIEVLVVAVCAVIACAESWDDIALYGRSKLAWLRTFLELANGIPSHDTFRRVFMLIDPDAFEAGFAAWVGSLADRFEREVVAIDGKTIRRSFDHGREQSALHVVSAWASEQGLVLGQRCVDGKSNEITAVPELLDQLALENSIVTLDAMGCQTAIAEKILARGGDYLLTLKGNHPLAHAAVVEHFDQRCFRVGAPSRADCDAFDDTHGRLVRRRVFASTEAAALGALSGWPGLRTVLAVESIRSVNSAPKVEAEIRYFLSSCPDDPAVPREPEGFAAGQSHTLSLGCGKRAALGAGCDISRGRQPRARPHGHAQPGAPAQDRAQHRRPRHDLKGQRARPAEKGRLERRLHAQASARVADNSMQDRHKVSCVAPGVEAAFRRHAALQAARATSGQGSIALGGTTLRGSVEPKGSPDFDRFNDRSAAQMLSAFATDTALVLAHIDVEPRSSPGIAEKSNEVPAAQTLLAELDLASGAIVTLDALHCQKN